VTSWKLPLIVAAIAVPIVAAFMTLGGGVGVAAGALVTVSIIVIAARMTPRGPIGSLQAADGRRHVLLVAACAVEEPDDVASVLGASEIDAEQADVMVLAPARIGFLDRWASDVEGARRAAQENLVKTVAALAKAGVEAEARVGDEDVVQAVEDQLQTYPATDVVVVSDADGGRVGERPLRELETRLRPSFRHLELAG
jgi:hypothetical protein